VFGDRPGDSNVDVMCGYPRQGPGRGGGRTCRECVGRAGEQDEGEGEGSPRKKRKHRRWNAVQTKHL
jgi:hypothetical protein